MSDPQIRAMVTQIRPEIILTPQGDGWEYKMVTPHKTVQAALDQLALLYTIEEIQLAAKALGAPK